MFDLKNYKSRICLIGLLISFAVLFISFYATDGLTGDKEFSQYTAEDWSIAILPLIIMAVSAISTLTFSLIIIISTIRMYPVMMEYVKYKKFSHIDSNTDFLMFDFNELKRACCRKENEKVIWFSVKEYNIKTRCWEILEEDRYVENYDILCQILENDYKYDRIKKFDYT